MTQLAQTISQQLMGELVTEPTDRCFISFVGTPEDLRFVEHAFVSRARGFPCFSPSTASDDAQKILVEIQPLVAKVTYDSMFRDGFLGRRKMLRTITVELSAKVLRVSTEEVLFSGTLSEKFIDTVAVGDVDRIESPIIQATRNQLPEQTFLDRIMEPVVMVAAAGVIVYLFFKVRS